MAVICEELVRAINSGRCFALVGAGASCELGLPTWRQLCELVMADLVADGVDVGIEDVGRLLDKGRSEERRAGKECRSRWSPDH